MTRFEELQAIIERNKKKAIPNSFSKQQDSELEVPGLTESDKSSPRIDFATDDQDMSLTDQLLRNPKHRPNDGSSASYWD